MINLLRKLLLLKPRLAVGLVLSLVLISTHSWGSDTDPLRAQLKFSPNQTAAGGTVIAKIQLDLDEGYHAYLDRFKLRLTSPEGWKLDDFKIAPIVQFDDSISKGKKAGIENSAVLQATIEVPEASLVGSAKVALTLTYQACTKDHCLFPKTIEVEAPLEVVDSHADARLQNKSQNQLPTSPLSDNYLSGNILSALLALFILGFLTSLTPCIYPMIPITLAILGTGAPNQGRMRGFTLSVVYVLGIAVTYSSLGIFAASTGSLFGSALSNPWVVSIMAIIFVGMALSMYGAFELQLPAFLRNRFGNHSSGAGLSGAFITGLLAGVVASPCVGPVLVSILTYIAQTQNRVLGFLFLFTFALGMGVLFVVLGTFSHLLTRIPKSGPWMESVKFIFGTVMVGVAFYYIEPIYPVWLFDALLGLALLLLASTYGAFEPSPVHDAHSNEKSQILFRLRKGLMIALFAVGLSFLILGVLKNRGVTLTGLAHSSGPSATHLAWQTYSDAKLANALAEHKPVILDFSADWCAACKELERDTFPDAQVRELSQKFVLLEFDATNESAELNRLKQKFTIVGLPTLVFYDVHGNRRDQDLRLTGFENPAAFLKRMLTALE